MFLKNFVMSSESLHFKLKHCNLCNYFSSLTCSGSHFLSVLHNDVLNILLLNVGLNLNLFPQHTFLKILPPKNMTVFEDLSMKCTLAFWRDCSIPSLPLQASALGGHLPGGPAEATGSAESGGAWPLALPNKWLNFPWASVSQMSMGWGQMEEIISHSRWDFSGILTQSRKHFSLIYQMSYLPNHTKMGQQAGCRGNRDFANLHLVPFLKHQWMGVCVSDGTCRF